MQKQILVKTPITTNGQDIVFDANDKRTYTESILMDVPGKYGARAILEQRNMGLPNGLKVIIEDYVPPVDETVANASQQASTGTLLDQLKMQAENEALKKQIADLQAKQGSDTVQNVTDKSKTKVNDKA